MPARRLRPGGCSRSAITSWRRRPLAAWPSTPWTRRSPASTPSPACGRRPSAYKAALSLAGEDRDAQVAAACAGLRRYTEVTLKGLWRDRLKPDDTFVEEPAPASSFYHIVCALNELFAAAGTAA